MDWNDLRFFLSVARSGSLTQTATAMGVGQSTVSRRIGELEASVGTTLFARHATGYCLTDEGREVPRHAEVVKDGVLALERGAAGLDKTPTGTVRVATSENLAADLIIPALLALRERFPGPSRNPSGHSRRTPGRAPYHHLGTRVARIFRPPTGLCRPSR